MPPTTPLRIFDGRYRRTARRTKLTSVKLFEDQLLTLHSKYSGNLSALLRVMVDEFLAGKMPNVVLQYNLLLKNAELEENKREKAKLAKLEEAVIESQQLKQGS